MLRLCALDYHFIVQLLDQTAASTHIGVCYNIFFFVYTQKIINVKTSFKKKKTQSLISS